MSNGSTSILQDSDRLDTFRESYTINIENNEGIAVKLGLTYATKVKLEANDNLQKDDLRLLEDIFLGIGRT